MYLITRGEVEVLDDAGKRVKLLKDGDFFGEIAILPSKDERRRVANVVAKTSCDLFVLDKADFQRILREHPQFSQSVARIAKERYDVTVNLS